MGTEFDNYGKKNIENIRKKFKETPFPDKIPVMMVNESGNGKDPVITEESMKKAAKLITNMFD